MLYYYYDYYDFVVIVVVVVVVVLNYYTGNGTGIGRSSAVCDHQIVERRQSLREGRRSDVCARERHSARYAHNNQQQQQQLSVDMIWFFLVIDYNYYVQNQLTKPLTRIFEPIMGNFFNCCVDFNF
jgi:DNA polymerase elongation subunit (family B)